ncbi:hypothetical protein [Verrucomicrobium spinosum]|uniref:hypothetical protein n=1 Tax=Verrucomicrobium spinosum TaxID=2736 RepID=UPI0001745E30|nr:hypothetical protein [Verrucomicrobium spinosum]
MKPYLFHLLVLVLLAFPGFAGQETMDLLLNDGSKIKGRVMSVTASEVTVMSDFGVLRLDLQKLTADTRAKLSETSKPDSAALLQRIVELEAKVSQLQQENEQLRRGALAVSTPARTPAYTPSPATGIRSLSPGSGSGASSSEAPAASRWTISSTGKRHNSGCRYYGSGRSCGPGDGVACKICGG